METLDCYNKEGKDLLRNGNVVDGLEAFWKGIMCLGGRMGNSLDVDNIAKVLNTEVDVKTLDYLQEIKRRELEIVKNILKCFYKDISMRSNVNCDPLLHVIVMGINNNDLSN